MPQLNFADFSPQLIWLAITFVALYFVMWKVALPRIGDVLQERQERISSDREKAESLRLEAEEAIKAYEKALKDAREQADATVQKAREELNTLSEAKRAEVEANLNKKSVEADQRIAASRVEAAVQVRNIATESAKTITQHLAGIDASETILEAAVESALRGENNAA